MARSGSLAAQGQSAKTDDGTRSTTALVVSFARARVNQARPRGPDAENVAASGRDFPGGREYSSGRCAWIHNRRWRVGEQTELEITEPRVGPDDDLNARLDVYRTKGFAIALAMLGNVDQAADAVQEGLSVYLASRVKVGRGGVTRSHDSFVCCTMTASISCAGSGFGAILSCRFTTSVLMGGAAELPAYGTAVLASPGDDESDWRGDALDRATRGPDACILDN